MQEEQGGSENQRPEYVGSWPEPADEGARQAAEPQDTAQADAAPAAAAPAGAAPGDAAPGDAAPGDAAPGGFAVPGGSAAPGAYGGYSQPSAYGQAGGYGQPGLGAQPGGYGQPGTSGQQGAPGAYGQPGAYGTYGQPGAYGQQETQGGYTQPGGYTTQPGGYATQPGGYTPPGGYGQPSGYRYAGTYGSYGQPGQPGGLGPPGAYGPPGDYIQQGGTRPRRAKGFIAYILVAAVAAGAGAGTVFLLGNQNGSSPAASSGPVHGGSGNGGLGFGNNFGNGSGSGSRSGSSAGVSSATLQSVVNAVSPGLVDITSNLGFEGGTAAATGMVISSSGLVLTNNHVISGSTGLTATLVSTGQRFSAKWLGYDKADDVAVMQLQNAARLRTVPLGDSSTVKLGNSVIALGNAEGAGGAPTAVGSITGLNRTITASDNGSASSETLHGMLQTNAGIVEGDSGGPLANTSGRVIGMDTAASTGSFGDGAGQQNVGFAIPINRALSIAHQIISGKSSPSVQIGSTGFIGVLVPAGKASQSTSPKAQRQLQIQQGQGAGAESPGAGSGCIANDQNAGIPTTIAPVGTGALILGDLCGTPAQQAGITAGDVITAVNGRAVTSPSALTGIMQNFRPGVSVPMTWVDTSGQTHVHSVDLVPAPPR